jgi:tetratricopeptide (TPR) repeat protein
MAISLEMLRKQAKEALARGQYQDALKLYERALLFRDDNPDIHYGIATIYFLMDDLEHAMEHFKSVINLDARRANAYINLGAVFHRMGQFDESVRSLKRGLQLDPNRAEGHYNLALVYKQLGEQDKAIESYCEAVRVNPRMYEALYNMGNIFLDKKEFNQAAELYRLALEIRPNCEKAKLALEAAQMEALPVPAEETSQGAPAVPLPPPDPDRLLDPARSGERLRDLHHSVVDMDDHGQAMLNFLRLKVEESIREVSICVLTPNDPRHNLHESLSKFDDMVSKLQQLHAALQQRVTRARSLAGHVLKA